MLLVASFDTLDDQQVDTFGALFDLFLNVLSLSPLPFSSYCLMVLNRFCYHTAEEFKVCINQHMYIA